MVFFVLNQADYKKNYAPDEIEYRMRAFQVPVIRLLLLFLSFFRGSSRFIAGRMRARGRWIGSASTSFLSLLLLLSYAPLYLVFVTRYYSSAARSFPSAFSLYFLFGRERARLSLTRPHTLTQDNVKIIAQKNKEARAKGYDTVVCTHVFGHFTFELLSFSHF